MQLNLKSGLPRMTLSVFKSLQDSQDLFDFQSPITEEIYIVNDSAHIYRKKDGDSVRGKKVKVVTQRDAANGDLPDFNFLMLFSLKIKNFMNQFQYMIDRPETLTSVVNSQIEQFNALPFICLSNHGRSNQMTTYKVKEGNILKFGKIFFRILQSRGASALLPDTILKKQGSQVDDVEEQNEQSKVCRICLMDCQEEDDLISPCDCKGSCRYVHLSCLQTWICSKVVRHENALVTSYSLAKFECELCKKTLPNSIKLNNTNHQLVQFHKPDSPYLVLERLEHNSKDKIIYVLTPNRQPVRIGRAVNLQMRINDISISRVHASIQFNDGCFYLKDLGSKFGSLILIQERVDINQVMCLQYGSKLYKMEVMPNIHPRAMAYI